MEPAAPPVGVGYENREEAIIDMTAPCEADMKGIGREECRIGACVDRGSRYDRGVVLDGTKIRSVVPTTQRLL